MSKCSKKTLQCSRRTTFQFYLDTMLDNEAKELLVKGFDKIEIKYDKSSLDKYIAVAGGYPHSLQVLGHHLIEVDDDSYISNKDWSKAIVASANELRSKDFSQFYSFTGKPTVREEIMNHLADPGDNTLTKTKLGKILSSKNIYQKSALPKLIQMGAVKENVNTGQLSLHSELFKSAIRFHLKSLEK